MPPQEIRYWNGYAVKRIRNKLKIRPAEWNGPTARLLEEIYGCKSPVSLFVSRARELVKTSNMTKPPFDPFRYARILKILVEEPADMVLDGTLRRGDDGAFIVYLKRDVSRQRKNFTLAHEIAHTFFYDAQQTKIDKNRGSERFDPEEERLCDLAAAELLMPFAVFRSDLMRLRNREELAAITPVVLIDLARRYDVSTRAVAIRASWTVEDLACVIWNRNGTINEEWTTPQCFKRLRLCQTGVSSVETAFDSPGRVVTRNDSFYLNGGRISRTTSSLQFRSGKVMSVIHPSWLARSFRSTDRVKETGLATEGQRQKMPPEGQYTFDWGSASA